ncbi:alpha-glucuronidase family glycosyl hydrolase [Algoriphagus sp. CAU 1675]|uniref:alpha-glucuronidase family glycosyl hydrolase n=1 Tax=Algoriphagus sp. CAU 1675 TaxID=3032597 RepID=UPI0023DB3689|nr:alpha-glucuronidase family glycosyl hydrolase [Algoriphagus sp. CAU 1675]MDF2158483.1 alpha-glucuronidase family glycosyl hydrolase [Algoriphagus sp. CAU 1675]
MNKPILLFCLFWAMTIFNSSAKDGYKLWLDYSPIKDASKASELNNLLNGVYFFGENPTYEVIRNELKQAGDGMLNMQPTFVSERLEAANLLLGSREQMSQLLGLDTQTEILKLGEDGYWRGPLEFEGKHYYAIIGNRPVGILYGVYDWLKSIQSNTFNKGTQHSDSPKIKIRMLNHWDNLDRTVERGYAGFSIWDWHKLPGYIDPRYIEYARANASIGINAVSLTNVNANARILTTDFMKKAKVLADLFRPYGIKVYLTARFSAPMEIGGLETADPLDPEVIAFWKKKTDEMYSFIPDFGGYLVKANSEGQPGPHEYGRNHAEGANMLADALAPHRGILIWRAFVYSHEIDEDRHKQANSEFEPLDGKFRENVIIQVKNGAIDFQPREPFHPLFGAVKETNLGMEFQITQEYLGQATQLVFLAPMWEEVLRSRTFRPTPNSTVAGIIDGSDSKQNLTLMAGVSNIGTDRNWTGHLFGQANWFAFGRQAWNPYLSSKEIAEEWIKLTFGQNQEILSTIEEIMLESHEAAVNYMTPLGLHHIMGRSHHYGPGPWVEGGRADWTSLYYHKADEEGIGFDRTSTGSSALSQYASQIAARWSDPNQIPEKLLLWFHHLPWDFKLRSGRSLWDEIALHYDKGVKTARKMKSDWESLESQIDPERFVHVDQLLAIQVQEAEWWRNACLLYFQTFSKRPFPQEIEQPEGDLDYYKSLSFPTAPGIRPQW